MLGLSCLALVACSDAIDQVQPGQAQPGQAQSKQGAAEGERSAAQTQETGSAQQVESQVAADDAQEDSSAAPSEQDAAPTPQQQAAAQSQPAEASNATPRFSFLPRDATETAEGIPIIRDSERPQYFGLDWGTDWSVRLVSLDELAQGAGRDAIPALSGPLYVTLAEAAEYYTDVVPVVQINVNGDVRGYPLEILTWHEIVNDVVGGMPVAVTFCPLCNTAIAFESQIGEERYRFGVSGLLRNSDLVMYDRNTESLWQQSSGRAIVGVMVGARLKYVPATVVSLGQLRAAHPDALILSRDTGWNRAYGQNPYTGYDDPESGGPYSFFFDRDSIDPRLPPAERVVSIEGPSGAAIAYAWSRLSSQRVLHDLFDGIDLVVFWTPGATSVLDAGNLQSARAVGATAVFETALNGQALSFLPNDADASGLTFIDEATGSVWDIFGRAIEGELAGSQLTRVIHSDHFWFAWQAFHPDTAIGGGPSSAIGS